MNTLKYHRRLLERRAEGVVTQAVFVEREAQVAFSAVGVVKERQRAAPTWAMRQMTDGLLRLFAASSAPIREVRNNGMGLVNRVPPLKRWLTGRALDS